MRNPIYALGSGNWESTALFQMGVQWMLRGDHERAKTLFQRALVKDRHHRGAIVNLGVVEALQRNFDQATVWFQTLLHSYEKLLSNGPSSAPSELIDAEWFTAMYYFVQIYEWRAQQMTIYDHAADSESWSKLRLDKMPSPRELLKSAAVLEREKNHPYWQHIADLYRLAVDASMWGNRDLAHEYYSIYASEFYFEAAQLFLNDEPSNGDKVWRAADLMEKAAEASWNSKHAANFTDHSRFKSLAEEIYKFANRIYESVVGSRYLRDNWHERADELEGRYQSLIQSAGDPLHQALIPMMKLKNASQPVEQKFYYDRPSFWEKLKNPGQKFGGVNSIPDPRRDYLAAIRPSLHILESRIQYRIGRRHYAGSFLRPLFETRSPEQLSARDKMELARLFALKSLHGESNQEHEKSIRLITSAVEQEPGLRQWIEREQDFNPLHADPRWSQIIFRPQQSASSF